MTPFSVTDADGGRACWVSLAGGYLTIANPNANQLSDIDQYRAVQGGIRTPRNPYKQAYWVLNGIGRYTTEWPLPDSNPVVATPWEITGRSEDELTGVMVQISQVVAKQLSDKK